MRCTPDPQSQRSRMLPHPAKSKCHNTHLHHCNSLEKVTVTSTNTYTLQGKMNPFRVDNEYLPVLAASISPIVVVITFHFHCFKVTSTIPCHCAAATGSPPVVLTKITTHVALLSSLHHRLRCPPQAPKFFPAPGLFT